MKVWKIGSRWSSNGAKESSVISVFRRSGIVFLGTDAAERFNREVKCGDYFAIADGQTIQAVAKAIANPRPLNEFIAEGAIKVRDEKFYLTVDYTGCYGVRVKIVDIPQSIATIKYKDRRAFVNITPNSIAKELIKIYEDNLSSQFDIKSRTYRIMATKGQKDDKFSIIDNSTIYNIPIYQREYSWWYEQVSRFIGDILKGYWEFDSENNKVNIKKEPLFIGTMQLSYKKYISKNESEQDVIDGQQRLSTILCLLKYLRLKYPEENKIKSINLNWLETRVNNGKENTYLKEMLDIKSLDDITSIPDSTPNKYIQNLSIIKDCFAELTTGENNSSSEFDTYIESFIEYVLNDIYFVVVETVAGLSKTIQIFNTINTAGLDLNGDDLFKVRMYEYLHDKKDAGEEAFNEIGEIYKRIKELNSKWRKTHDYDVISVNRVRSVYKYYLISKYKLPVELYSTSTDTFFDELFDTLLGIQSHNGLNNLKNLELSLDDLRRICEVVYMWNTRDEYSNYEDFISCALIQRSRYSRYSNIAYLILLANENLQKEERFNQVYECLSYLSKLFFCFSIQYSKAVNEIHSLMRGANGIYNKTYNYIENKDDILKTIKAKIDDRKDSDWFREECIGQPIAWNRKYKDLICVLSAYFDEVEAGTKIKDMIELFSGGYDIEHIHANGNIDEGTDISEELQNGIGNLMLLEYDINRSIGCLTFEEKKENSGNKCYKHSKYATVKKICKHEKWLLPEIENRRKEEIEKIAKFLFE